MIGVQRLLLALAALRASQYFGGQPRFSEIRLLSAFNSSYQSDLDRQVHSSGKQTILGKLLRPMSPKRTSLLLSAGLIFCAFA
jgi:hypothetical protein